MSLPWSRNMKLDPGTFGGSPACHVLVDMMNNDVIPVQEKHRVLSFINSAIIHFQALSDIKSYGIRSYAMNLMRDDLFAKIDRMAYPEKFNSHLKNVLTHHLRRYLNGAI